MRRLLFIILSVSVASSLFCHAQSCKVDLITLTAKIEANPDSVLYAFGDAIALSPDCLPEFLEAAIVAANPDEDTLTQIIRLAVSEYPSKSGEIAEAAVLASPENVEVIRAAFVPEKKPIVATPVLDGTGELSPIETFLASYVGPTIDEEVSAPAPAMPDVSLPETSVEILTSKPSDPEDVAVTAIKSIDELVAKLKAQGREGCGPGDGANVATNQLAPFGPTEVEMFRLNIPDQSIGITTINDPAHHDLKDEVLETPGDESLVITDPVPDSILVNYINEVIKEKENAGGKPKVEKVEFTSSVYHIPSPQDIGKTGQLEIESPVIRSTSVSPTLPRGRR